MTTEPGQPESFGQRTEVPRPVAAKPASEALRPQAGTPPPRRWRRSKGSRSQVVVFFNFLLSIVVFAVLAAGVAVYLGKAEFEGPGPTTTTANILIKPGTGVSEIADQLERRGMISDARVFRIGLRAYGNETALKAGEYEIKAGASMHDIMNLMKSGKSVMYSLTIPEGLTVDQALQRIADTQELAGDMPATLPPEGMVAADTHRFTRGTPRQQIIDKLVADQKQLIDQVWARRAPNLPIRTVNEFVTLASIVEKETGRADERPRVAAVFINRLRKNMRLQSDPTIIYGLFGGKGKPSDRPIYQSDLDKKTPYNTYLINGLPPTPIANPGRAALEAVANPSMTDELYFVADGTGGHVFATTLDEHNDNVARWRAQEKLKADTASQPAATTGATPKP